MTNLDTFAMKTFLDFIAGSWVACIAATSAVAQAPSPDYSKTNSVTVVLAEAKRRETLPDQGLRHHFWQRDGYTQLMDVEGVPCRNLDLTLDGYTKGYFYFSIDPSFKNRDVSKVRIDVEYFDGPSGKEGVFGLQYDATESPAGGGTSKQWYPNVPLKGSGRWLKASFHVRDGTFKNSQNGSADFRLWASPPQLAVRRVTLTLEPQSDVEAKPLNFDPSGRAALIDWNPQWDSGSVPTFARTTNSNNSRWLEIRLEGAPSTASWRTCPWLTPGEYQFVGRATSTGAGPDERLALRASGQRGSYSGHVTSEITTLSYEFTVTTPGYIELVCEYTGSQGAARFDLSSLKLIRKSPAAK